MSGTETPSPPLPFRSPVREEMRRRKTEMKREERKESDPEDGGVVRRRFSIVPRKTKAF